VKAKGGTSSQRHTFEGVHTPLAKATAMQSVRACVLGWLLADTLTADSLSLVYWGHTFCSVVYLRTSLFSCGEMQESPMGDHWLMHRYVRSKGSRSQRQQRHAPSPQLASCFWRLGRHHIHHIERVCMYTKSISLQNLAQTTCFHHLKA